MFPLSSTFIWVPPNRLKGSGVRVLSPAQSGEAIAKRRTSEKKVLIILACLLPEKDFQTSSCSGRRDPAGQKILLYHFRAVPDNGLHDAETGE
jgi:hypothetical protein